jgi:hypothetical protein
MAWKECHVVDERVRFVRRLLDGTRALDTLPRIHRRGHLVVRSG